MCTELFLAILYFSTIFAVNFFLFKLLKTYTRNITYLLKVQNIFKQKLPKDIRGFILLHLYSKKNSKNVDLVDLLNKYSINEDVLTIGNTYSYLLKNSQEQGSRKQLNNFYLELLENQYLSKNIELNNLD
jgi:hypothetical protein|tara:strand:- start:675 stop:1064 length:390 start_codon:yes stop_codon:yes gene_type:complete